MTDSTAASQPAGAGSEQRPNPVHVAIIMDGNGRWASKRGLPRAAGHERGVEALRRTVEAAPDLGIRYLTLYSFSTENWRRPASEVNALFGLLKAYVHRDLAKLNKRGVNIRIIGARTGLPSDIAELVKRAENVTQDNRDFYLTIAFNYGAREEIARAVRKIAGDVRDGKTDPSQIDEAFISAQLDTGGLPDPDLLIRTSGEYRLSNFLMWQLAYTELVFMDVLWPDFDKDRLAAAIAIYRERERRFGALPTGTT